MGNELNVSFHSSEIGNQLDIIYISFKCGTRRELTQVARARASGLVHIARCACERLAEQNRARDRE